MALTPALHFPIDFERREDARRFCRAIGDADKALAYLFRMWVDWATTGVDYRELRDLPARAEGELPEATMIVWNECELTFIIEDFCGWTGKPGELLGNALAAGVLRLERRGMDGFGTEGLVLNNFWQFNSHLSPHHKTMQQKGAIARNARRTAKEIEVEAAHQVDVIKGRGKQFALPLDVQATPDETKKAVALIMMIDRACGKPLRKSSEYTQNEQLMINALNVVRGVPREDIEKVYEYVIANRDNPRLGKIPGRIIEHFGEHLGKAKEPVAA